LTRSKAEKIAANLSLIRERVAQATALCGRSSREITILAVSKTFPVETITSAIAAGQLQFGENRVQEAESKITRLQNERELQWHLVGHLQSNKARRAAELFDVVHSLDGIRIATRLSQACRDLGKTLSALLQVDLGREEAKFGASLDEVRHIVAAVSSMQGLELNGLMTLPPFFDDPERARPYFSQLRELRDRLESEEPGCLGLQHLSMGMSNDFEVAIREGATIVRVGTAIFGERHYD